MYIMLNGCGFLNSRPPPDGACCAGPPGMYAGRLNQNLALARALALPHAQLALNRDGGDAPRWARSSLVCSSSANESNSLYEPLQYIRDLRASASPERLAVSRSLRRDSRVWCVCVCVWSGCVGEWAVGRVGI